MSTSMLTPEEVNALWSELHGFSVKQSSADTIQLVAGDRNLRKRMPLLERRFEVLSERIRLMILKSLRFVCPTQTVPLDIVGSPSARNEISNLAVLAEIKVSSVGVVAYVGFDSILSLRLIEQAFGAPAQIKNQNTENQESTHRTKLTEVELHTVSITLQSLSREVCTRVTGSSSIESVSVMSPLGMDWPSNVEYAAVWRMNFELGDVFGHVMVIVLPLAFQDIDKLASESARSSQPAWLAENVSQTPIEIKALLGNLKLSLAELLSLRTGDVIPLNGTQEDPIPVLIENKIKFMGKPTVVNGLWAVTIESEE
jgi:flagellar motor switch protein FliM